MSFGSIANAANPSLSTGLPYFNRNTIYSFVDNLSEIWRTHTFKAGLYLGMTRKVQSSNAATGLALPEHGILHPEFRDPTNTINALVANFERPYKG